MSAYNFSFAATLILLFVAGIGARHASAQTATIEETVSDPGGATLPAANVGVRGPSFTYGASANQRGRYEITGLPAGSNAVEIRFVGHKTVTRRVSLEAGSTRTLNFTLESSIRVTEEVVTPAHAGMDLGRFASSRASGAY